MAIAFVATNGKVGVNNATQTYTFTTTRQINAGEHVVVIVGVRWSSGPPATAVSVGSLSLTRDVQSGGLNYMEVWSAPVVSNIASGSTVTVTLTSATSGDKSAISFSLSGVATSSYLRASATNPNASGANGTTGTTDTTPQVGDMAIGGILVQTSTGTFNSGGTATLIDTAQAFTQGITTVAEYLALTSAGATSLSFTNPSNNYSAGIGIYKPAGGGTPAIVPAAINATSAMTAAVQRLRPIPGATVNATSAMTASVQRLRPLPVAAVTSTSNVTAALSKIGAKPLVPAAITATSPVTATLTGGTGATPTPLRSLVGHGL